MVSSITALSVFLPTIAHVLLNELLEGGREEGVATLRCGARCTAGGAGSLCEPDHRSSRKRPRAQPHRWPKARILLEVDQRLIHGELSPLLEPDHTRNARTVSIAQIGPDCFSRCNQSRYREKSPLYVTDL